MKKHQGRPATANRTPRNDTAAYSWASSPGVRGRMQRQRTRDTQPELAIRRLLHAAGLRYRVDVAPTRSLRRRADIVFGPARVAVFVDGCFWHGCPQHGSRKTKTNTDYWSGKVARNQARDTATDGLLTNDGWLVIRVWEHEDPREAAERIASSVHKRRRWGSRQS
ncbi:DNA mismatch endonuclease Vsr [Micromonospora aurantiaca ATCC 27029]|nr:DNA mismatch endonuclease Vsr [Micromonospora aurantiaca ATCC 27029]